MDKRHARGGEGDGREDGAARGQAGYPWCPHALWLVLVPLAACFALHHTCGALNARAGMLALLDAAGVPPTQRYLLPATSVLVMGGVEVASAMVEMVRARGRA